MTAFNSSIEALVRTGGVSFRASMILEWYFLMKWVTSCWAVVLRGLSLVTRAVATFRAQIQEMLSLERTSLE